MVQGRRALFSLTLTSQRRLYLAKGCTIYTDTRTWHTCIRIQFFNRMHCSVRLFCLSRVRPVSLLRRFACVTRLGCFGGLARRCAGAGLDVHAHVPVEQARSAAREEARLQHEELQGAMKKDVVRLEEALAWAKAVAQVCVCACVCVCVCLMCFVHGCIDTQQNMHR